MRIWHDDLRRPPDPSWWWARTNAMAMTLLRRRDVKEISLDHDMGLELENPDEPGAVARAGSSLEGSGLDLVEWMCRNNLVPPAVTIHSWNPVGAAAMAARLNEHGYDCIITPYKSR